MYGFNTINDILYVKEHYEADIQYFLEEEEIEWDWYYNHQTQQYGMLLNKLKPWQRKRFTELFPLYELPTFLSRTNLYGWITGVDENNFENIEDLPTLRIVVDERKAAVASEWLHKLNICHEAAEDICTVSTESERGFAVWYVKIADIPQNIYDKLVGKYGEPFCLDTKYSCYVKRLKEFPERVPTQTLA